MLTLMKSDGEQQRTLRFWYTNYRGERSERACRPHALVYGRNEWHPEVGLLLTGYDLEKGAMRSYAVDQIEWGTVQVV